jgi:hypothetical protein
VIKPEISNQAIIFFLDMLIAYSQKENSANTDLSAMSQLADIFFYCILQTPPS